MEKRILSLIPEALQQDLINEVVETLKEQGYSVEKSGKSDKSKEEAEADIKAWANEGKSDNNKK